jgi:phosphoribosylformylglycinamidine (FGAM) synthase-like amidotransferase family enzyme
MLKVAVVRFPGSNCDADCRRDSQTYKEQKHPFHSASSLLRTLAPAAGRASR